jgi:hypothetical protein
LLHFHDIIFDRVYLWFTEPVKFIKPGNKSLSDAELAEWLALDLAEAGSLPATGSRLQLAANVKFTGSV